MVGTVANVQLDTDNWTGHRFNDFFNRVTGRRPVKIVSQVFYLYPDWEEVEHRYMTRHVDVRELGGTRWLSHRV